MLSRALISATAMLLIGCFAAVPVQAQAQNLEAGKSPSQIFAGTCTACHKSPRGLLKTVPAGSLPGFLRQHYTTSPDMASLLSSYLISNGANDTRYSGGQPKNDGKPAEQVDRWGRRVRTAAPSQEPAKPEAEPEQAAKPDADGLAEPGHKGRKRPARPADQAAKPVDGEAAAHAVGERGPDGRKSTAKQRLGRRGKPSVQELPSDETAKDASRPGAAKEEPSKGEAAKPEAMKPSGEAKPESTEIESPKDTGSNQAPAASRPDPVPSVTPAAAAAPPAASGGTPEPAAGPSSSAAPATIPAAPPPAQSTATTESSSPPVTASVPPPSPAGSGSPVPPISK
ncbi:hypothetical protein [Bradyrhizobium canariense]|uniref:Cytochrome c domain-containing protein n=1 Tax=Bradyrhizobium canariense TaxID=255045 RepID=A0A1H1RHV0_9BRAD|nr:hypothetical protein [Bradyrhizobium canariense]SDS35280.1 hypothetical protein SAMN05444158_1793 [Bradyrhizobium canariense]